MKRCIAALLAATLLLTGCEENRKTIDGITYDTFGLITAADKQNPNIEYDVEWGNVVLAVIYFETIIAPIYVFGFDLFEPVGRKTGIKGQID